jgi:homocitrate synthase NifV
LESDLALAATCGTDAVHLSFPASPEHLRALGKDKRWVVETMQSLVPAAQKMFAFVSLGIQDAPRVQRRFLFELVKFADDLGVNRLRIADTIGILNPLQTFGLIAAVKSKVPEVSLDFHGHNDLGMATANSIAAIEAGAKSVNVTVGGLGERAGNADLVSCVLALKYSSGFKDLNLLDERINLHKAWKLAKYASHVFDVPIPINQPGVGSNAFAHESGIHADGALKDRKNYELYDYEDLGRGEPEVNHTGRIITTGAYGGIKGFLKVYQDLGIHFESSEQAHLILELVQYADLHTGKPLVDDELRFIAAYPEECAKIMTITP